MVKLLLSTLNMQDYQIDVIKLAISVLLHALCKAAAENKLETVKTKDAIGRCQLALQDWIARRNVIGGRYFGEYAEDAKKLRKGPEELKVIIVDKGCAHIIRLPLCIMLCVGFLVCQ